MTPLERFLTKCPEARRVGSQWYARCRAHDSRSRKLAVTQGVDGRVLVRCLTRGCTAKAIFESLSLKLSDGFASRVRDEARERRDLAAYRARLEINPEQMMRDTMSSELRKQVERRLSEGSGPRFPTVRDINAVRARASLLFKADFPPLPVPIAESAPHDNDPAWLSLYEYALEVVTRERWHRIFLDAPAWETRPGEPSQYDHFEAELRARQWLRELALADKHSELINVA